jgi:hypothetical protein
VTISRCLQTRTLPWFLVNDPEGVVFEYEVIGAVDDETG